MFFFDSKDFFDVFSMFFFDSKDPVFFLEGFLDVFVGFCVVFFPGVSWVFKRFFNGSFYAWFV